ncbi:hypothetical protein [Verminephrobacter eiseniae]|nr:hypothetical protein [Verminephrobacter eiseniae]
MSLLAFFVSRPAQALVAVRVPDAVILKCLLAGAGLNATPNPPLRQRGA